jgi:hypothetical protein
MRQSFESTSFNLPCEVAVNDNAVEAVVDERKQVSEQLGEQFHGHPHEAGQRIVEGKSFRLADEVRYIQRRAADRDGRIVTIGQLVLFSTKTGDANSGPSSTLSQDALDTPDANAAVSGGSRRPGSARSRARHHKKGLRS